MARSAHALRDGDRVWLVDPYEDAEALERAAALGAPAGVLQLLDRHDRDCAALAARLGVPHPGGPRDAARRRAVHGAPRGPQPAVEGGGAVVAGPRRARGRRGARHRARLDTRRRAGRRAPHAPSAAAVRAARPRARPPARRPRRAAARVGHGGRDARGDRRVAPGHAAAAAQAARARQGGGQGAPRPRRAPGRLPAVAAAQRTPTWTRYVALGDSTSEGLQDPYPDGRGYRGWADRLAERLAAEEPGLLYANLAVRGKLARQIREEQLDAALALGPDLCTVSGGLNDVLRRHCDLETVVGHVDAIVATLRGSGATVLIFTYPNRVPTHAIARPAHERVAAFNAAVRTVAARRDAVLVDFEAHPVTLDPRLWHPDRLHANSLGHERIAAALAHGLGLPDADAALVGAAAARRARRAPSRGRRARRVGRPPPRAVGRAPPARRVVGRRPRRQAPELSPSSPPPGAPNRERAHPVPRPRRVPPGRQGRDRHRRVLGPGRRVRAGARRGRRRRRARRPPRRPPRGHREARRGRRPARARGRHRRHQPAGRPGAGRRDRAAARARRASSSTTPGSGPPSPPRSRRPSSSARSSTSTSTAPTGWPRRAAR